MDTSISEKAILSKMKLTPKTIVDVTGATDHPDFDPENCLVLLSVEIGLDSEAAGENFHFIVVTHKFLEQTSGSVWGRALLIVDRFDLENVGETIENLVSGVSANISDDGIKFLSLYMDWDYAGMASSEGKVLVPASADTVLSRLSTETIGSRRN